MTALQWFALRLVALIGVTAGMASLVELVRPTLFCGFEGDCEDVTQSPYARPAGIPLPIVGVAGFALIFLILLFPSAWRLRVLGPLCAIAGVAGLALFLIQVVLLKKFCTLCLFSDFSGVALAMLYFFRPLRLPADVPLHWNRLRYTYWGLLAIVALSGPWLWSLTHPKPAAPEQVRSLWMPGKVTIVLVTDFDCPRCREFHPLLMQFVEECGEQVHFVELVYPMMNHVNAGPAARAYHCACQQGQGKAMSKLLFQSSDISAAGILKQLDTLLLDRDAFMKCFEEPELETKLEAETAWVRRSGAKGLPALWIQDQFMEGTPSLERMRAALQRAQK